jgi:hypothetical protein
MISLDKSGGRTVHLFIPFEHNGTQLTSISLAPLRLGHVLRWNEGAWKTMIDLMVDLAGVEETVIRELRYPDADRVMESFMALLTPEIRDDVANGRIPKKVVVGFVDETEPEPEEQRPRATNGGGEEYPLPRGPGAPLPESPGFDLSEEP